MKILIHLSLSLCLNKKEMARKEDEVLYTMWRELNRKNRLLKFKGSPGQGLRVWERGVGCSYP